MKHNSPELDAVQLECLNLLIVYYSYRQTISTFNPSSSTRFELHRWWIQLRVFENDLILRICRLDDDDKTNHSLREALRAIRSALSDEVASETDRRLKKYRQLINPLKTKARNYFLAHLSKSANAPTDPRGGLEDAISDAINIVDLLSGTAVSYKLKVASDIPSVDLRAELFDPTARSAA